MAEFEISTRGRVVERFTSDIDPHDTDQVIALLRSRVRRLPGHVDHYEIGTFVTRRGRRRWETFRTGRR